MRLLPILVLLIAVLVCYSRTPIRRRVVRSIATVDPLKQKEIRQEQKERRILRKKKQRLKELRDEVRKLSLQLRPRGNIRGRSTGDGEWRWRRKLIDKLKAIVRRLDRLEKATGVSMNSHLVTHHSMFTTSTPMTSIVSSTDSARIQMKRIQSAIVQARSGENGTSCAAHSDCRPGRCCERLSNGKGAQCTFFSFGENVPCVDSCQCANRLLCFRPKDNSTMSYCKPADSMDISLGSYANNGGGVFASKKSKRKK